jgi:hypothetical protein
MENKCTMSKRKGSVLLKFGLTTLALILLVQLTALPQAVKPKISTLDSSKMPPGCSYTLDDWKGNTLAWAPYLALSDSGNFLVLIDGQIKAIPINKGRNEEHISAFDGKYYIEVRTPVWKRIGSELRNSRATFKIINTHAHTETKLIVRASQGC